MTAGTAGIGLSDVDAVILCGGSGTRLQSVVADRPKALALVRGRPFIDILLDRLIEQGLRRFVLCVGYMRDQIVQHVGNRHDATFVYSEEAVPLGTGGAIRNAFPLVMSDPLLILNGDSFCRVDLAGMLTFHLQSGATATILAAPRGARRDAGTLQIEHDGRLTAFEEKSGTGDSINAGIYLVSRAGIAHWPTRYPFSIERDVMPQLIADQPCFAYRALSEVYDIGTPDRYLAAQDGLSY
jgi:NDP-sugar pyrophosphorylase family protein